MHWLKDGCTNGHSNFYIPLNFVCRGYLKTDYIIQVCAENDEMVFNQKI